MVDFSVSFIALMSILLARSVDVQRDPSTSYSAHQISEHIPRLLRGYLRLVADRVPERSFIAMSAGLNLIVWGKRKFYLRKRGISKLKPKNIRWTVQNTTLIFFGGKDTIHQWKVLEDNKQHQNGKAQHRTRKVENTCLAICTCIRVSRVG